MNGYPTFYYDNRFKDAAPVASSTAAGDYNVLNLNDWAPFTWWKPNAMPATVTENCGTPKSANYCLVYGHDLFTQGATFELRGSTDNFAASDVLVATKTPTDNKAFLLQFATATYQYWRYRLTGATAPAIAIAAAGMALAMPRRLRTGFDPLGREPKMQDNRSAAGHPLSKMIDYEEWGEKLAFRNLDTAWLRANFEPAWKAHLRGTPFIFAWDPTDHGDELYLTTMKAGFKSAHQEGAFTNLDFDLRAVVQP